MAKSKQIKSPTGKKKAGQHSVEIKKDKCKGCSLCVIHCPVHHLTLSKKLNKRGVHYAQENPTHQCIGCGFCYVMCPDACIEVMEEE